MMTLLRMMMIANLHEIAEVLDIGPLRINQLHNHLPQLLRVRQLPVDDHLDDHTHDQPMNHVDDQPKDHVDDQIYDHMGDQSMDHVDDEFIHNVDDQLNDHVDDQLNDHVYFQPKDHISSSAITACL